MNALLLKTLFLGLSVATGGGAIAQDRVSKDVQTKPFVAIKLIGAPDVVFRQSTTTRVELWGDRELVDLLETEVDKGTLLVRFKDKRIRIGKERKAEVRVWAPVLKEVIVSGAGDFSFPDGLYSKGDLRLRLAGAGDIGGGAIRCANLEASVTGSGDLVVAKAEAQVCTVSLTGSGDVELRDVSCTECSGSLTGSGDVKLSGKAATARFRVSGSGDLEASGLEAEKVSAVITGSGYIGCRVNQELEAKVSGSGTVKYEGNPPVVNASSRGVRRAK